MRNVATVSSGWNFQTKSLLRMFVPPLSRWLCATVPSLSIAFFSLSLSLFHSLILFASFQRKQGPFYCPSLFRSSNTHTKKESLILLLLLFLFPLPKIFCTFGVCVSVFGLSICVSDVLFAFAPHPIENEREMNSYSCVQSTATF